MLFTTLQLARRRAQAADIGAAFDARFLRAGAVAIALLAAACATEEAEMDQAVLFSALEGQVIQAGQPLAGATIVREWDFPENKVLGRDEATTDASGHFRLAAILHPYRRARFFPQEPLVVQTIRVSHGGMEWRVWSASKMDLKAGTESNSDVTDGTSPAQPIKIVIDLDSPRARRGMVVGHTVFNEP